MSSPNAVERELIEIERSLWANDATVYEEAYLPGAVLIFPEVGRIGRDAAVAAIREENATGRRWASVSFAGISCVLLSPDVALLSYEATARWNDESVSSKTLCATVYVEVEHVWRVAFHQQTGVSGIESQPSWSHQAL